MIFAFNSASDLKYLILTPISTKKAHENIPAVYIVLIQSIFISGDTKSITIVAALNTNVINPAEIPSGSG